MTTIATCLIDRANFGRLLPIMRALKDAPNITPLTIVGGTMLLDRFGHTWESVAAEYFTINGRVWCEHEGNTTGTMARSLASAVTGFVDQFEWMKPDFAIVIGDRYEALGAAIAATYTSTKLIHFQGGETSGCLDDRNRHAITALADYHVPATEKARARVLEIDPRPEAILTVGCPSSDLALGIKRMARPGRLLAILHPDTDEDSHTQYLRASFLLDVFECLNRLTGQKVLMLWPNIDAGADMISKCLRQNADQTWLKLEKNIPPVEYLEALADAPLAIGNSSSFVRDSSFFGTPVILLGNRQQGRELGPNVICAIDHIAELQGMEFSTGIARKIDQAIRSGPFRPSTLYGDGHVSERFIEALRRIA